MSLSEVLHGRGYLMNQLLSDVEKRTKNWGIDIIKADIEDITVDKGYLKKMDLENVYKNSRKQDLIKAENDIQIQKMKYQEKHNEIKNEALVQAEAIKIKKEAEKEALMSMEHVIRDEDFVKYSLAKDMAEAWNSLANKGTTVILPANPTNISRGVAEALATFDNIKKI